MLAVTKQVHCLRALARDEPPDLRRVKRRSALRFNTNHKDQPSKH